MTSEEHSVVAIIPMKPLSEGKSRLARTLSPAQRARISAGMLRRVLTALRGASIDPIWVVGGDDQVMRMTRNHGGMWHEEMGRDLNDTLGKAISPSLCARQIRPVHRRGFAFPEAVRHPFLYPGIAGNGQRHPGPGATGRRH